MRPSQKTSITLATLISLSVASVHPAAATVTLLTGGDTGEGFAPLASAYGAVNLNGPTFTVQNVTFTVSDANFAFSNVYPIPSSAGSGQYVALDGGSNDNNINQILSTGDTTFGNSTTSIMLTLSNLDTSRVYQVDSLFDTLGAGSINEGITATGLTTVTDTQLATGNNAYDVQQILKPDLTGSIQVVYSPVPNGYARLSGVSVSSAAPVPEVSSFLSLGLLLVFGSSNIVVSARRHRKATL